MTSQIRREPTQCKRDSRATRTKSAQRADKLSYLWRAIRDLFGEAALVQRCQVHKLRNVIEHLPEHVHASVRTAINDAWMSRDAALALKQLERFAPSRITRATSSAGATAGWFCVGSAPRLFRQAAAFGVRAECVTFPSSAQCSIAIAVPAR